MSHLTPDARRPDGSVERTKTPVRAKRGMLPAMVQPRPAAPITIKRGLEIDWDITVIAAFSFLLHFGLLGSIYSDWRDPPFSDGIVIESLVESLRDLPTTETIEEQVDTPLAAETSAPNEVAPQPSSKPDDAPKKGKSGGVSGPLGGAASKSSYRASLASQLAELDLQMNTVLNTRGPSTDRVLTNGQIDTTLLDQAARSDARVSSHISDLAMPTSTPPEVQGSRILAQLGNRGSDSGGADSGHMRDTVGPRRAEADVPPPPKGFPEGLLDAPKVVGGLQGAFRRCYQSGLDREDDTMEGSLRITMKIGPNGEVVSATPSGVSGNLSGNVVACMVKRASGAQFKPPVGGGATLVVPVAVRRQK
ncbi:MAG: hypothetical protein HOW73_02895 [Polyangiaceae bacterium]|nr:hypothetical protein [Polyangiaceae bacterium]